MNKSTENFLAVWHDGDEALDPTAVLQCGDCFCPTYTYRPGAHTCKRRHRCSGPRLTDTKSSGQYLVSVEILESTVDACKRSSMLFQSIGPYGVMTGEAPVLSEQGSSVATRGVLFNLPSGFFATFRVCSLSLSFFSSSHHILFF